MDGKVHVWVGGVGSPRGEEGVLRRLADEGVAPPISVLRVAGSRPGLILQYHSAAQVVLSDFSNLCTATQAKTRPHPIIGQSQTAVQGVSLCLKTCPRQCIMYACLPNSKSHLDPLRVPRRCTRWTVMVHLRAESPLPLHHSLGLWEVAAAPYGLARSVAFPLSYPVLQPSTVKLLYATTSG